MDVSGRPTQSVSTAELYNRWAKYYDVDGNILQAVDDQEIPNLLKHFFSQMPQNGQAKITEFGCGTGRNTIKLIQPPYVESVREVYALDLSDEMLQKARKRCEDAKIANEQGLCHIKPIFRNFDAMLLQSPPVEVQESDGVISTLVLEHIPIDVFFKTVKDILKIDGCLLLTNMHEEMGKRGQAGFVDSGTGEKIRGMSFNYSVDEVIREAQKLGFQVVGGFNERGIEEADIQVVGKRGHKWLGYKVWFGCILRYSNPNLG